MRSLNTFSQTLIPIQNTIHSLFQNVLVLSEPESICFYGEFPSVSVGIRICFHDEFTLRDECIYAPREQITNTNWNSLSLRMAMRQFEQKTENCNEILLNNAKPKNYNVKAGDGEKGLLMKRQGGKQKKEWTWRKDFEKSWALKASILEDVVYWKEEFFSLFGTQNQIRGTTKKPENCP